MTASELDGMRVAILVANGFEQVELIEPRKALKKVGAETKVFSPAKKKVRGWHFADWGKKISVDVPLDEAQADDFDALLLPGGVMNPDTLRIIPEAVAFVKAFVDAGKPVASICRGPWTTGCPHRTNLNCDRHSFGSRRQWQRADRPSFDPF